jgi:hypothetical protein
MIHEIRKAGEILVLFNIDFLLYDNDYIDRTINRSSIVYRVHEDNDFLWDLKKNGFELFVNEEKNLNSLIVNLAVDSIMCDEIKINDHTISKEILYYAHKFNMIFTNKDVNKILNQIDLDYCKYVTNKIDQTQYYFPND